MTFLQCIYYFVYLMKYFSGKNEDEVNNFINEEMFEDEMNNFINEEMVGDEMINFNNEPIYDKWWYINK